MSKRLAVLVAFGLIIVSSAGIVTMINAQEGAGSRVPVQSPKPLEAAWAPDRTWRSNDGTVYRLNEEAGLLVSTDGGSSWTNRTAGLPQRAVWPFDRMQPPLITSLATDPRVGSRVALTTPEAVWLSADAGASWQRIEVREPLRPNDQLTCVGLAPDGVTLAVGTSFHGLFETSDRGGKWIDLTEKLTTMQLGGGNYEEIASVAYDPVNMDQLYLAQGFGKGLWRLSRSTKKADRVPLPGGVASLPVVDLAWRGDTASSGWQVEVRTHSERWMLAPDSWSWRMVEAIDARVPMDAAREARAARATGKVGIYVSAYKASGKYLDAHLAFIKAQGFNSLVVDCKDDYGNITYDTRLEMPKKIGAVQRYFKADELVARAHAEGLYLIGRIVVFRDKGLYNVPGNPYAAWDRVAGAPWRYVTKQVDEETGEETLVQGEYWVDPYSPAVWQYNIDIARELEARGFDEVQFDYIRFPSDGDVSRITWRFQRSGMGKVEALESFLKAARASIQIPISVDVYGYCGWARISNWVAQSIEVLSRHVDVISPMFYPSHFPQDFLGGLSYLDRAHYIYREGGDRSSSIVEGRSLIRPYVQAFRLGSETKFSDATTSAYLLNQVQGALESAASGFTLWNASNDYYMVMVPLGPLIASAVIGQP